MRELNLIIPRLRNNGTHCWAIATSISVLATFHHIFHPNYPQPMQEGQGQFVHQFLALLNSAREPVDPLRLFETLVRELLPRINPAEVLHQYQASELLLDSFFEDPLTGPGCPFFQFLQPETGGNATFYPMTFLS